MLNNSQKIALNEAVQKQLSMLKGHLQYCQSAENEPTLSAKEKESYRMNAVELETRIAALQEALSIVENQGPKIITL